MLRRRQKRREGWTVSLPSRLEDLHGERRAAFGGGAPAEIEFGSLYYCRRPIYTDGNRLDSSDVHFFNQKAQKS